MNSLWHGTLPSVVQLAITPAPVTGVAGTSAIGSLTVVAKANVALVGVSGTGAVNRPESTGATGYATSGVSATGQVGSLLAGLAVYITGTSATGQVSSIVASIAGSTGVTGVEVTGHVGTIPSVIGTANVTLNGVVANATAGGIIVWGDVFNDPGNTWTEIL